MLNYLDIYSIRTQSEGQHRLSLLLSIALFPPQSSTKNGPGPALYQVSDVDQAPRRHHPGERRRRRPRGPRCAYHHVSTLFSTVHVPGKERNEQEVSLRVQRSVSERAVVPW